MSGRNDQRDSQDGDDLCIVCFKDVEYYSVGLCDHPVCYECSTRMRVLCNQNECPICRAQMPKVIFTNTVEPFNVLMPRYERTPFQDRKYGLIFTSPEINKAYKKLLEFRCNICCQDAVGNGGGKQQKYVFHSFPQLKDHMRREHALSFCSLCVDNLKIFCFERKCYTQQELGVHRRKGDADDTSHRGHPLCEFCDTRFMDSDELFRHLRRNHLFCHLCDADGKHQYYPTMADLTRHYQEEHYLCEEGDCKNMPLTAAFRTEIDLKAHIAIEHGRHLSKSANKQARTLELEFTLAPRPRPERRDRLPPPQQHFPSTRTTYQEEGAVGYDIEPGGPGGGSGGGGGGNAGVGVGGVNTPSLNPQNFPALGGSNSVMVPSGNFTSKANPFGIGGSQRNLTKNAENFPCLGAPSSSASGGPGTDRLSVNNTGQRSIQVNQFGNGGYTTTTTFSSTRPASSSTVIKKPTSTSTLSSASNGFNQQKPAGEAFPALGKASSSSVQPKWVQQKSKKQQESKQAKVAPAPRLPPSDLSQFPVLSKSSSTASTTTTTSNKQKKSSSVTVPVSGDWTEVRPSSSYVQSEKSKTASDNGSGNNKSKKQKNKKNNSNNTTSNNNTNNNQTNSNNNNNGSGSNNLNNNNSGFLSNKAEQPHLNGMVKKRSELKIGQLSSTQATASGGDGTKPPPGFPSKPPPGLGGSNFPGLGGSNDLTFTNSRGQSYSITPAQVGFHQPTNFASRNQKLFLRLADVADNDSLREFKSYSALFREGRLPAKNYYEHCKSILKSKFDDVFPELLVLLPDIEKQQGLYNLYQGASKSNLLACENCKQVIYKRELSEHYSYHTLDSQFPSLGAKAPSDSTNAWRK